MTSTPLSYLLEGRPIDLPLPLPAEVTIALLDWMSDINHGPTGAGPESLGAEQGLRLLGYHLQQDRHAGLLLGTIRAAVAHESAAERRAPSAATAIEAARALQKADSDLATAQWLTDTLPTPIHARYALSLIVETGSDRRQLFEAVAEHLLRQEGAGEEDWEYVDRLRTLLGGVDP